MVSSFGTVAAQRMNAEASRILLGSLLTLWLLPGPRSVGSVTLETGLIAGGGLALAGLVSTIILVARWSVQDFAPLDPVVAFRLAIPAVLLLILGCQTILGSFFLSILGLRRQG
jgi:hypothetical protein